MSVISHSSSLHPKLNELIQVITVTGSSAEDRANLGRLIELHGGTYDGQMSRRHCTHLIAASNSGEKYRRAVEWGTVRVVTPKWLRKSIETGYRMPEERFPVVSATNSSNKMLPLSHRVEKGLTKR